MLLLFCIFGVCFLVAAPAAVLVRHIGCKRDGLAGRITTLNIAADSSVAFLGQGANTASGLILTWALSGIGATRVRDDMLIVSGLVPPGAAAVAPPPAVFTS